MPRTLEQLRSHAWPTRAAAVKDLKASGFAARGPDYELREVTPGSWQVVPRDKPAAKVETPKPQAKPEPEPERKPEPEPETKPAAARVDLTALPTAGGPYSLAVRPDHVQQNSAVNAALDASRMLKVPVDIHGPNGQVVRVVDHAAVKAARKAQHAAGGRRAPGRGDGKPNPMIAAAVELARRPEGVTREQLRAVSPKQQPWTAIIKDAAVKLGLIYRTSEATSGSSRVVYHLDTPPAD